MSYDIWTEGETNGAVALNWNYTYNVQPMIAKAGLPSLNMLNGVAAPVAVLALDALIDRFYDEPEVYRALNPENGWGDFDGFRQRLEDLRDYLLCVPKATVRVG